MRPSGESPERLTHQNAPVNFLAPIDSRTLLYVARAEDWSGPWLWALDVESKVTRRVTAGLEQYTSVSASRDGRRIVATVANPTASLWRVPLLDRLVEDRDAQPYPVPSRTRPGTALRRGVALLSVALVPWDRRWALAGPERSGVRGTQGRRRRVVGTTRGVTRRQPRGGRRETGGKTAPCHHVRGRHQLTNPGCVHRHPRRGGARRGRLVARRHLDRHRRRRWAGAGVVQDPGRRRRARAARHRRGRQSGLVAER